MNIDKKFKKIISDKLSFLSRDDLLFIENENSIDDLIFYLEMVKVDYVGSNSTTRYNRIAEMIKAFENYKKRLLTDENICKITEKLDMLLMNPDHPIGQQIFTEAKHEFNSLIANDETKTTQ